MDSVDKEFTQVLKKQKLMRNVVSQEIDTLMEEISKTIASCKRTQDQSDDSSDPTTGRCGQAIVELANSVKAAESVQKVNKEFKSYHAALSKCIKTVDKAMCSDIIKICRTTDCDSKAIDSLIVKHLYREGQFDSADCFIKESGIKVSDCSLEPLKGLHRILLAMKEGNLDPALRWAKEKRAKLLGEMGNCLEYKLIRLRFLELIKKNERSQALQYAQEQFPPFMDTEQSDIKRLMGCFLYFNRLESSPYSDLFNASHWEHASESLIRACCELNGQCYMSHLSTCVAAGIESFPLLRKMVTVVESRSLDWNSIDELPVEVPLGKDLQFHNIFACPVSSEKATNTNPPVLLKCGHVICKACVTRLLKNSQKFKCPTCPSEQTLASIMNVYF